MSALAASAAPSANPKKGIARRKVRARLARTAAATETAHAASVGAAALLRTELPGLLAPENALERTHKLRQPALADGVDAAVAKRGAFALDLSAGNLGPYIVSRYSRSGRAMLVASQRGHVALATWRSATLHAELQLNETVRDACFLHNDSFFAVAQKSYVHVYDASGVQLHVMRNHRHPGRLVFLPFHMLLVSASAPIADTPCIAYTDTSTGTLVSQHDISGRALNLGAISALDVNPSSAVLNAAHSNGVVSLWSPVQATPLVRMFTHPGGVSHVASSLDGKTMVTAGTDATVRAWDMRTYKQLDAWTLPSRPTGLAVSQRGLVAASFGATVHVWAGLASTSSARSRAGFGGKRPRHAVDGSGSGPPQRPPGRTPYMVQQYSKEAVTSVDFCPFEDLLAVGHVSGMASMIVPGAGEATFDSKAPNPYVTTKWHREAEVRDMIDKLRPETIALDVNSIGGVDKDPGSRLQEMRLRIEAEHEQAHERTVERGLTRKKGRGKIHKQLARKQKNVVDARKVELQARVQERREANAKKANGGIAVEDPGIQPALRRFYKACR
jgi:U3 small nucleolar RNA-associated protein 7